MVAGTCRLLCKVVLVVATLLVAVLAVVVTQAYREPPPSRGPLEADLSACRSETRKPKPDAAGPRQGADFDIVVYGAASFMGKLVTHYLATAPGNFNFAIAGPSWAKLDKLDAKLTKEVEEAGKGRDAKAILVADFKDASGLRKIARKAGVILSLVSPYSVNGALLVQICAEEGTHYADASAESFWHRRMVDSFHSHAQFSGAKVVLAAGYESLPFDLGAAVALQALDATKGASSTAATNATVTALVTSMRGDVRSLLFRSGDAASAGKSPADWAEDPYLLAPRAPCRVDASVDGWGSLRYDEDVGALGLRHSASATNARIVRRSLELLGRRGVSYREGMSMGSLLDAALFGLRWVGATGTSRPKPGKGLPPSVQRAGGWQALVVARDEASGHTARVDLRGRGDPGYMHSSRLLAEMGLCLLDAACHRAGIGGGVLTPASAANTEVLVTRLRAARHDDGRPVLAINVADAGGGRGASEL